MSSGGKVFLHALERTLFHEGGYSNHPHDPGGATKYGISLRFLRSHGLLYDVDQDGDVDQDDLMVLTSDPQKVRDLYYEHFWKPISLDRIYSDLIKIKVFDTAVNTGCSQAAKLLQSSMVAIGAAPPGFAVDGKVGPATVALMNQYQLSDSVILGKYRELLQKFYTDLIRAKPSLESFRLGWARRAVS